MRRGIVLLLGLLGLALAALLLQGRLHPGARAPRRPFPLASCRGETGYSEAVIRGELRLHRGLLPSSPPDLEALRTAASLQIRYALSLAQNDPAAAELLAPDGPPHDIEILSQSEVPYGKDLVLDWPADGDESLHPESDYVRRALARGQVAATDAAARVRYRARLGLARCRRSDGALGSVRLRLPVPQDPYLAYWHIDKSRRIEREYRGRRLQTFPCADPLIAEYAHPEYLWYYFQPDRKEPDCAALLREGRELGRVDLELEPPQRPGGDLRQLRRRLPDGPLRIALLLGYLSHDVERPSADAIQAILDRTDLPPAPDATGPTEEWGSNQYVRLLQRLPSRLDRLQVTVTARPEGPSASASGRLRLSGRPVELDARLMETDFLAPPPYVPRHLPFVLSALPRSDVFIYAGHSGLGANLSVAALEKAAAPDVVARVLADSPVRLFAFIGCYTYSYFGPDFARRLRGGAGTDTLFAYTGSAVEDTADRVLDVLAQLDCLLATPEDSPAARRCDPPAPARDFLIYDYGDHAR